MATYKISFLAPRKASSLESKRTTQTTMFQPLYRKNSKTRRENVELPTTIPLKSYRKATLTETRNKSTQRNLDKLTALQAIDRRIGFKKDSQSLELKQRLPTKLPTARIYTEREPDKVDFTGRKSPPKRSLPKNIHTQEGRKKSQEPLFDIFQPLSGSDCAHKYRLKLTPYERNEVMRYPMVYCLGQRRQQPPEDHDDFDDEQGEMKILDHDHIGYRYEVKYLLGKGSFGQVFKAIDHKLKQTVALKVIKNKAKYNTQALVQIKILEYISQADTKRSSNVVEIIDSFVFRGHTCIVFEMLKHNLYDFLKMNGFNGFPLDLVRRFTIQVLQCLMFLEKHGIVHCDLKPENILLKHQNKSGIKIIDFGSGCFEHERIYTYIQSRFYRAPEIIIGIEYTTAIDMWSLGCIICELFLGYPIFPGENQNQQLGLFMEVLGVPPRPMIQRGQRKRRFFDESLEPKPVLNSKGKPRKNGSKPLETVVKCKDPDFIQFIRGCFEWQPERRLKASQGLLHPWIIGGLPEDIREQHLLQMRLQAPHLFLD